MNTLFIFLIIVSAGFIGYAFGNVTGWASGKEEAHARAGPERARTPQLSKQMLIDDLIRYSFELDPRTGDYEKIETIDAEIICPWCDDPIIGVSENVNGYCVHPFCAEQSGGQTYKLRLIKG